MSPGAERGRPAHGAAVADDEIFIVRAFAATRDLVFRLWEDPEHRIRWWGAKGATCTHFSHEFGTGGAWRACITSAGFGEQWQGGVYREIERDRRIVFTFAWDAGPSGGAQSVATVTLASHNGMTVQTFHQAPFANLARRDNHLVAWSRLFDSQQAYAEARGDAP